MPEYQNKDNLFFGYEDKQLFQNIAEELLGGIVRQHILYWKIDIQATQFDDVYGETREKVFRQPVKVNALVEFEHKPSETARGAELIKNLNIGLLRKNLEELHLEVREGDFVQFGNIFFEIMNVDYNIIQHQPQHRFDFFLICNEIRQSELPEYMLNDDNNTITNVSFYVDNFVVSSSQRIDRIFNLSRIPLSINQTQLFLNDEQLIYGSHYIIENAQLFIQTSISLSENDKIIISYFSKKL